MKKPPAREELRRRLLFWRGGTARPGIRPGRKERASEGGPYKNKGIPRTGRSACATAVGGPYKNRRCVWVPFGGTGDNIWQTTKNERGKLEIRKWAERKVRN
jgi:hypothetical protein